MHHLRVDLRDPHLLAASGDDVLVVTRHSFGETTSANLDGLEGADVAGSVCDCVVETLAAICVGLAEGVSLISRLGCMESRPAYGV